MDKGGLVIDATGKYVRLTVKVDDVSKLRKMDLYLGTDLPNCYVAQVYFYSTSPNVEIIRSGKWAQIGMPSSAFSTVGTPPAGSTITWARLLSKDLATGPLTVRFGGIAGVAESTKYPNGVISLTFDVTHSGQKNIARPTMDAYGYVGTLYPITGSIGSAGCWTLAQGLLMQANGWDYGAHASTGERHGVGLAATTEAEIRTEMETIKVCMRANGLRGDSFAYPLNTFNLTAERVVGDHLRSAGGGGSPSLAETVPPRNTRRLRSFNFNAGLTVNKAYVDRLKAGGYWGVFALHDVKASGATGNGISTADFRALIDYISAQGVAVRTVSQVIQG